MGVGTAEKDEVLEDGEMEFWRMGRGSSGRERGMTQEEGVLERRGERGRKRVFRMWGRGICGGEGSAGGRGRAEDEGSSGEGGEEGRGACHRGKVSTPLSLSLSYSHLL